MRASFILLGPLLTRFGQVIISNPGGDRIGRRPVDLHVDAMRALGADDRVPLRLLLRKSPGRLRGGEVRSRSCRSWAPRTRCSRRPSPRATRSIRPAAQEPEVDDLIAFLQKMGAEVERTAPDTIEIEGRKRLRGAEHRVIPDRIEAGTFIVAAARDRRRRSTLQGAPCDHLEAFIETLRAGSASTWTAGPTRSRSTARACAPAGTARPTSRPRRTRASPRTSSRRRRVLLTQATGRSHVHEAIFEDRLEWLGELRRMGAKIDAGRPAARRRSTVRARSHGADVEIGDLRAGASLILAALAADGHHHDPRCPPRPARL